MEKSLNEDTYEKLKYDIMNFKLVPGDSISAQKIAVRYNVSRTPAREAIVNLEKESLQALQAYQIFLTVQEARFLRISVYGQDAILLLPVQAR